MAALAALKSVKIRPKQLSKKFWKLLESTGNHFQYRSEYFTGPGLPCPMPHVRELEHTQQPQTVLAEILRSKSYLTSRNKRPDSRTKGTNDEIAPKIQHSNKLCLICRQKMSEYNGLRLKCILVCLSSWNLPRLTHHVGAECYRRERSCGRSTVAEAKVRKHAYEVVDEEEHPLKRVRAVSTNSQDMISSRSQMSDGFAVAVHNSSSSVEPKGSQSDFTPVARFSIPPTPPRTPPQQTAFSLPNLSEFDAGLSRLRTESSPEQSRAPLHRPPLGTSQESERIPPLLPLANTGAYYVPFTWGLLGDGRALSKPPLPPPQLRALAVTSDPSLGEMFAEAARAAGRQFYPPPQGEIIKMAVPSSTTPAAAAPSGELKNNWPPQPRVVSRDRHVPIAYTNAGPPRDPGEAQTFSRPRNKAVWRRVFPPTASPLTTTAVPDGEILHPGAGNCGRPEAALGHSIKQSRYNEYSNRSPPNTKIAPEFRPVNQALSATLVSPVTPAQHGSPTEPRFVTFTGSVPKQKHSAQSPSNPTQVNNQEAPRAVGGPQQTTKPPNPFSRPLHCAWSRQNPLPDYHTINTTIAGLASSAQQRGGGQTVEWSSSSLKADKGKGKLIEVEVPPKVLGVPAPSLFHASFEESIRRSAKGAMELVNIHRTN
jgi:hypothetical protein